MSHIPKIVDTLLEYIEFGTSGSSGPVNTPDITFNKIEASKFEDRVDELQDSGYFVASIVPIHRGALDYMGDNMSVGGMSPTEGIMVHFQKTCCSERMACEIGVDDEKKNDPDYWQYWAACYDDCGDFQKAADVVRIALMKFPENAHLLYDLACYECEAMDYESSKKHLEQAIKIDPTCADEAKTDSQLFPLIIKGLISL